jgi:hypothetical protein
MQHLSRLIMIGSLVALAAACDDGGSGNNATGGTTGSGGGGNTTGGTGGGQTGAGTQVTWNEMGWIEGTENEFQIVGPWYSYDDCVDAAGLPCTVRDTGSKGPDMKDGWSVKGSGATGEVCAKGTAPKVQDMTTYAKQWGFGIAFDLNSPTATKLAFDAAAKGIKGFAFDITGSTPSKLRINVTNREIDNETNFKEFTLPIAGSAQVPFTELKQGSWITDPALKRAFDPTKIYSVQFHVFTDIDGPRPYDFCVKNFRVLK